MNVYDMVFDLSSPPTLQFATPAGAKGYIVDFGPDGNDAMSGTVALYLGQGSSPQSRLCVVASGQIRVGTVSNEAQTAFTIIPSPGAQGWVRVKLTSEPLPEARY